MRAHVTPQVRRVRESLVASGAHEILGRGRLGHAGSSTWRVAVQDVSLEVVGAAICLVAHRAAVVAHTCVNLHVRSQAVGATESLVTGGAFVRLGVTMGDGVAAQAVARVESLLADFALEGGA